jgi:hypothetical protein
MWDLGVGPLLVAAKGKTAQVELGDVFDRGRAQIPSGTIPVTLQRGRLMLNASYSPRTGLLYLRANGAYRAGRPNAALFSSLRGLLKVR